MAGLPALIPTERKIDYLRKLIAAGFRTSMRSVLFLLLLFLRWRTPKRS
jgi:hypothetical protein